MPFFFSRAGRTVKVWVGQGRRTIERLYVTNFYTQCKKTEYLTRIQSIRRTSLFGRD